MKKLSTGRLFYYLFLIASAENALIENKKEYEKNFLKQAKILYHLFNVHGEGRDEWYYGSFGIGTLEDAIPEKMRNIIVLPNNPTFFDFLCHTMIGCLVSGHKLTCNIGRNMGETSDIIPIIKEVAKVVGLKVTFSKKRRYLGEPQAYSNRFATFSVMEKPT